MGMYGLSLFFLNMEPPALALAVLDLTMTGVFFSRQSLNVMMESGFMMKEHLIERGTFGLRFC